MKQFYLYILIIVSFNGFTQNQLSSLVAVKNFPKSLEKPKTFIETLIAPYLMYDFITGGTTTSSNNYQFTLKTNKDLVVDVPFSNGMSLSFFDYNTKKPVNSHKFYVDYEFEYLKYYNDFIIDERTFSPAAYFDLASKINMETEQNILLPTYLNLLSKVPEKERFSYMLKEIGKNYKMTHPKTTNEIFNSDADNLSLNDKMDLLSEYLSIEIEDEISTVVFKSFVANKSLPKTWENLEAVFGKDIVSKVEEVMLQNITIITNKEATLHLPENYLSVVNNSPFVVVSVKCVVDAKNSKLTLTFKGEKAVEIVLKNAIKVINGKSVSGQIVNSDEITLVVSNSGNSLFVQTKFTNEKYKVANFN